MKSSVPRVLITGANGFIGSHLLQRLLEDVVEVRAIPHQILRNFDLLKGVVFEYQPSIIIHLAAYGNLITQQDDDETIQANYINLHNLLKATKDIDYEMFVNFSTSSVSLPVETMYSSTKASGERLCRAYAQKYLKPIVSVRPYTVIGTGEPSIHLIPTLLRSCLTGEKMRFVGEPVHDFIGVDDFVEAIRLIIEQIEIPSIIEIGTGIKTSNREILQIVEEVVGKKANIIEVRGLRSYDVQGWVADPAIIKSLGWEQRQSIRDIIEEMYGEIKTKNTAN